MKKLMIFFAAGCLGAVANSLAVWICGQMGVTSMFNVAIAPALTPGWIYPRVVWGGIWGLFFILPFMQSRLLLKGAVLSLLPSAVQLFVIFPYKAHKGFGGLELGLLTPLFVLLFNWVWGVVTAAMIKIAK